MSSEKITTDSLSSNSSWKRIGKKVIDQHAVAVEAEKNEASRSAIDRYATKAWSRIKFLTAHTFLYFVHKSARLANKPLVDIGREYSVTALNDRIVQLEEILVRQWTNMKEGDFLVPNEEIKQYVAACHVARQYDRITPELVASRLGISPAKAEDLIGQMVDDEILTESYTVTYHDVRRASIDATIERKLKTLHQNLPADAADSTTTIKKH